MTKRVPVSLIGVMMYHPPEGMEDYAAYRIEYGGHAMDCLYEGMILLPPEVEPDVIERLLNEVCA